MPDKKVGGFTNLNKDSTHPNPYRPPSFLDQFHGMHHNAYKIYRHPMEDKLLVPNPDINPLISGTFLDRILNSTWKGFVIGTFASCMDMVFIQQSVSLKTNIARWLYITPPIMMMPVSYTMTQELLARQLGDRHLTYSLSSLAPAIIWGFFSKISLLYLIFGCWYKSNKSTLFSRTKLGERHKDVHWHCLFYQFSQAQC